MSGWYWHEDSTDRAPEPVGMSGWPTTALIENKLHAAEANLEKLKERALDLLADAEARAREAEARAYAAEARAYAAEDRAYAAETNLKKADAHLLRRL